MSGCSATTTEPYALRVIGNSMSPEFEDGNIIIVDPAMHAPHGAYVVIELGDGVHFGQLRVEDGIHRLHNLSGDLNPIELQQPYEIKGVVVQRSNGRRRSIQHYDYTNK